MYFRFIKGTTKFFNKKIKVKMLCGLNRKKYTFSLYLFVFKCLIKPLFMGFFFVTPANPIIYPSQIALFPEISALKQTDKTMFFPDSSNYLSDILKILSSL